MRVRSRSRRAFSSRASADELTAAGDLLRQALELRRDDPREDRPGPAETLQELGEVLGMKGDLGSAEEVFRQALELRADDARLWRRLGEALGEQDPNAARDAFRRAVELAPDDARSLLAAARDVSVDTRGKNGQEIGMACDISVASDLALLGQAGPKHGSAPDGGSTDFLPWFLSMEDAMFNCISCEMWSAYKMKLKGLVTTVVPVLRDGEGWLRNPSVVTDRFVDDNEIRRVGRHFAEGGLTVMGPQDFGTAFLMQGKMSYPTTVFLDENLELISPVPGYLPPEKILPILEYIGDDHYKTTNFQEFMNNRS